MDSPKPPMPGGDPNEKKLPSPQSATAGQSNQPGDKAAQAATDAKDKLAGKASDAAGQAKDAAAGAVDSAKHAASDALDQGKRKAAELKDQAVSQAKQTGSQLQAQVGQLVGEQTTKAADQIDGFAHAIRRAADTLHEENDENLAGYADTAAATVEKARDYLRDRGPSDLYADLGSAIRKHPEWGLGGMFILGLAAGRFLKAGHTGGPTATPEMGGTRVGTRRQSYSPDQDLRVNRVAGRDYPPATGGGATTGRGMTDYDSGSAAGHASAVPVATPDDLRDQGLKGEVH